MTEYLLIIDGEYHSRWPRVAQALSVGHVASGWRTWEVHKTSVPALNCHAMRCKSRLIACSDWWIKQQAGWTDKDFNFPGG